jgi:hypothetical protein
MLFFLPINLAPVDELKIVIPSLQIILLNLVTSDKFPSVLDYSLFGFYSKSNFFRFNKVFTKDTFKSTTSN